MRNILYRTQPANMTQGTIDSDGGPETLPIGEDMIVERDQGAEVTSRGGRTMSGAR